MVMIDGFGHRGQIATVAVWRGVANIPELSRQKLTCRNARLRNLFVAKELIGGAAEVMTLQIRIRVNDSAAFRCSFQPRLFSVTSHIEAQQRSGGLQVAGRVERVR